VSHGGNLWLCWDRLRNKAGVVLRRNKLNNELIFCYLLLTKR
jgi:hypothetical protein